MDFQIVIVGVIILLALLYVGRAIFGKIKSFSPNQSCGSDCGCGVKDKKLVQKL
jgi:hypothetical protein